MKNHPTNLNRHERRKNTEKLQISIEEENAKKNKFFIFERENFLF